MSYNSLTLSRIADAVRQPSTIDRVRDEFESMTKDGQNVAVRAFLNGADTGNPWAVAIIEHAIEGIADAIDRGELDG